MLQGGGFRMGQRAAPIRAEDGRLMAKTVRCCRRVVGVSAASLREQRRGLRQKGPGGSACGVGAKKLCGGGA